MAWEELEEVKDDAGPQTVERLSCKKLNFHTASPVVLPPGLWVLRDVLKHAKEHERELLITAHTDTVDSAENNQGLSDRRARSVLLLIQHELEPWAQLALEHHRPRDVSDILKWAAVCWLWPCDPDRPGGVAPLTAFKRGFWSKYPKAEFKEEAPQANLIFWKMVFSLYQTRLHRDLLGITSAQETNPFLDALKWLDDEHPSIGCGERHLLIPTQDNVNEPENRRIEILFVKAGTEPELEEEEIAGHPGALESFYDPERYKFFDLECPQPSYHGHELERGNLLFILDTSTSMKGTRVERARRELIGAIHGLSEDYNFGVVTFGADVESVWWEGPSTTLTSGEVSRKALDWRRGARPALKVASEENRRAAIDRIAEIPLTPATQTSDAFEVALRATGLRELDPEQGERNTLEFLSDGSPNANWRDPSGEKVARSDPRARQVAPARECAHILAEVKANNATGWVINATAFFPQTAVSGAKRKDYVPPDYALRLMRELPKQGPEPGAFSDNRVGLIRFRS